MTAALVFSEDRELVDFVSDDRLRASADGRSFTPQRWSTRVRPYRTVDSRRIATNGEGRWHAPTPGGEFGYLEFNLDHITYNTGTVPTSSTRDGPGGSATHSSSPALR